MSYTATVAGVAMDPPVGSMKSKRGVSDSFDLTFFDIDPAIAFRDEVKVFRDGTLTFCGIVEKIRGAENDSGESMTLEGRDYGAELSFRRLPDNILALTEPADAIRAFLRPTVEVSTFKDGFDGDVHFAINRGSAAHYYGLLDALDDQANKNMLTVTTEAGASAWTNYLVKAYVCPLSDYLGNRLSWTNVACGVIGGYADANNYIAAYLGYDVGTGIHYFYLSKVVAGVETVLASTEFDWSYPTTYSIALKLQGTAAYAFIDGAMLLSGVIPAGFNTGNAGLISGGLHANFDDFFVSLSGKTATASINSSTAINAIDGNLNTEWTTGLNQGFGQWFQLDLGVVKTLCRLAVFQDPIAYARNYKIEVSDGGAFVEILSRTLDHRPVIDYVFEPTSVRYVKITITVGAAYNWNILEFGVHEANGDRILEEGVIEEFGTPITFSLKGKNRLQSGFRVAEICGWDFWVGTDKKANFSEFRGSDKSGSVSFERGETITGEGIKRERELDIVNNLRVYGHGEGDDQYYVTVSDQDSIDEYGQHDGDVDEPDLVSLTALYQRALVLLSYLKNIVDKLTVHVNDVYDTNSYNVSDLVQVINLKMSLNAAYRIMSVDRRWAPDEQVTVELASQDRSRIPPVIPIELMADLKRSISDISNYPSSLAQRYEAEEINGLTSIGYDLPSDY